jgi:starvation-inducible outer membrane lipoprotein
MSSRKILNSYTNMLVVTLIALLAGCSDKPQEVKEQPNLKDIAHEAFIYAYPMMEQVKKWHV